jgi:putative tryptophan/tyrosine transport system substrate-binding protein
LKTGVVLNLTAEGYVRRRDFIKGVAGSTVALPLAAGAQQSAMPVIGFLDSRSSDAMSSRLGAFRQGLKEVGFVEGENLKVEYRWADNQINRVSEMATELVRRQVDVIVATGGPPAALAAKSATATIPIVFLVGEDPTRLGLVSSLIRPNQNLTGVNLVSIETEAKRLELRNPCCRPCQLCRRQKHRDDLARIRGRGWRDGHTPPGTESQYCS